MLHSCNPKDHPTILQLAANASIGKDSQNECTQTGYTYDGLFAVEYTQHNEDFTDSFLFHLAPGEELDAWKNCVSIALSTK